MSSPLLIRLLIVPSLTTISLSVKSWVGSLKLNLTVAVSFALSVVMLLSMTTVGGVLSAVKLSTLLAWLALPALSVNVLLSMLTLLTVEPLVRMKSAV